MNNFEKKLVFLLKVLFTLICSIAFCAQLLEIYDQYSQGATSTAISYNVEESMFLPHFTVCPKVAAKKFNLYVGATEYLNNTFALEELFHKNTLDAIARGDWSVTEVRTNIFGRCFTFRFPNMTLVSTFVAKIYVKPNISLTIHIHEEGEGIWLTNYVTPVAIKSVEFTTSKDVGVANVRVRKSTHKLLNRKERSCSHYDEGGSGFTRCAREYILTKLRESNNDCYFQIVTFLLQQPQQQHPNRSNNNNSLSLTECTDKKTLKEHSNNISRLFFYFTTKNGSRSCPLSCKKNIYEADIVNFHPFTSLSAKPDEYNLIYLYYKTMEVEQVEEVLVYDFPRLLSALGGSMGLFLGFSCLGVLLAGLKLVSVRGRRRRRIKDEKGNVIKA